MPLQTQFSLSLELTKLFPLGQLVSLSGHKAWELAKALQRSGSDVVVEADLAQVFGRYRIDSKFESAFRRAVTASRVQQLSATLDIVLEAGSGPTVRRSLQDRAYFSTVAQLSLLTWTHTLEALSRALTLAFERRLEGAPTAEQPFPNPEMLQGTLRACREQTSGYQWHLIVGAVEAMIRDFPPRLPGTQHAWPLDEQRGIPYIVLQALLDVLLVVQKFPEDRFVRIYTDTGVSTIVMWAHHLLGLTVTVRSQGGVCAKFGEGAEQVVIQIERGHPPESPSVCLLDGSGEEYFRLSAPLFEDPPLEAEVRHPVAGFGKSLLERHVNDSALVSRLSRCVVQQCLIDVNRQLVSQVEDRPSPPSNFKPIPTWADRDAALQPRRRFPNFRLLSVAELLFGEAEWVPEISDSREDGASEGIWKRGEAPQDVMDRARTNLNFLQQRANVGNFLRNLLRWLRLLIYSLGSVSELEGIRNLPLRMLDFLRPGEDLGRPGFIKPHKVLLEDRKDSTPPEDEVWIEDGEDFPPPEVCFSMLSRLLLGRNESSEDYALVSAWGWSIYVNSISSKDPANVRTETFNVAHGVPSRYGIRKTGIRDGSMLLPAPSRYRPSFHGRPGQSVSLHAPSMTHRSKIFVGMSGPDFEATERFEIELEYEHEYTAIGLRRMQKLCWKARRLPSCEHVVAKDPIILLPEGTWALSKLDVSGLWGFEGVVLLVAGNRSARWSLLMSLLKETYAHALLRGEDCCHECAATFALKIREEAFGGKGLLAVIL